MAPSYFDSAHFQRGLEAAAEAAANPPPTANIMASVYPWSTYNRQDRHTVLEQENWQQKVRTYDRHGPGILGASLDMPAATAMLLGLCVRKRNANGTYEIIKDDPRFAAALGMWRGDTYNQQELFSRLLRTLDGPAEAYLVLHNAETPGRLYWDLAQATNVQDNRDGTTSIRKRPGARRGTKWHQTVPDRFLYHAMNADLEWEGQPWSPMRRALPHIDHYRLVMRNIGRNLRSQLAMNGILWAKAVTQGVGGNAVVSSSKWVQEMDAWARIAIHDDDSVAATVPFAMQTAEKPEYVEVGRGSHADQIEVAELFLKAFAQSSDLPTQMLLEGPGQGNHWSSYLESDFYADYTMGPRWRRACSVITETHLRPLMRAAHRTFDGLDPELYEVWCDDSSIRTKTDNTSTVMELGSRGIATRQALADLGGLTEDQIIPLPEGVTEYEHWMGSRAPATLGTRAAGLPGIRGLMDVAVKEQPDTDTEADLDQLAPGVRASEVEQPDRDESEERAARQIAAAAEVEITGEAQAHPTYWNELVAF